MKVSFPTYKEIQDFFYKNFNVVYSTHFDLSDLFEKSVNHFEHTFENIYNTEPFFYSWQGVEFPVFIHNSSKKLHTKEGKLNFDIYLNTFVFLSGWLEILNSKRDMHGRFPYEESLQKKYNFIKLPVVNIYFELLFELAKKQNIQIEKNTFEKPVIFTHDIDQLRSGWFENIQFDLKHFSFKSIFRIPKNIYVKAFNLEDDYLKGMKKMLSIDQERNVEAISFLLIKKSHQNADFDIFNKKYNTIIQGSIRNQKIGIHPSYETYKSQKKYQNEIDSLEAFSNEKITQSRQHFLRYDMKFTPKIIENSSIEEDFSLGFAEQFGFRNAIVNPFHLYNFEAQKPYEFKSIPLVFMDISIQKYSQDKNINLLFQEVEDFISKTISNYNCNFSILFHNSVFSNVKFEGFTELYVRLLTLTK